MSKRPNYKLNNLPKLIFLCESMGFEVEQLSPDQYRVYAANYIIDFWPARMVYHRIKGESIKSIEPYHRSLDWMFNRNQVIKLLETGEL